MSVFFLTGSCPQTEAEARLELADIAEAMDEPMRAAEWRLIVRRMRTEWVDRSERGRVRRAFARVVGPDPDALVTPFGTPEHPVFWHEPRRDGTVVCPCGHFAGFLCDEPIGRGRTCDKPTCRCCRNQVGPDLDQCQFHAQTQPREARP